ncbi:MAG: methylmalonyl-CoA mutase small subunit [Bacteroidaceae bacterium]|nr:methylmalonyl-CoA mutase small subunit [Bacteroidaceae bacterium]
MDKEKEKLFSEFPPVSAENWKEKIIEDLKGADYEKKMIWRTGEGFNVNPFYRKEDLPAGYSSCQPGEYPYTRGNRKCNCWLVRQDINIDDAAEANAKAKKLIGNGVDSIAFKVKGKLVTPEYIPTLLDGIDAEKTELNFNVCPGKAVEFTQLFAEYCKQRGFDLEKVRGSINYDPIAKELLAGKVIENYTETIKALIEATAAMPEFRCITVNSGKLNNAGAYITQELGYALAWGNEYLNAATEAGIPIDAVARNMKFNMGISSNFFMEIAKFRAARTLWAKIVEQYAPECKCSGKMNIHAETSEFNLTLFDSYVNMLRTQTEAMSAAIAGVESITVTPFDRVYEEPTDFALRIAKNQQLILKHESHLDKVVDPAGGSYYIESLTASIAAEAWKIFLAIEEDGGFHKAVKEGKIQKAVEESGNSRRTALAKRKEVLLGTNQYPNFSETSEGRRPIERGCGCHDKEENGTTLAIRRLGEEFEQLRLRTEESGKRPRAFMLTIGNLAMRQARAQFSCNFLATAGYEVIDNLGFKSIEEGVAAALEAKADIVVICSSDDEYAEYAIPAFKAIGEKAIFIVAGAPACMEELQKAGIENFIHVRVNVLETLKGLNAKLGI